jgi:hypothetical protein
LSGRGLALAYQSNTLFPLVAATELSIVLSKPAPLLDPESEESLVRAIDRSGDRLPAAVAREELQCLPSQVVDVGLVFDDVSAAGHRVDVKGETTSGQNRVEDHGVGDRGQA